MAIEHIVRIFDNGEETRNIFTDDLLKTLESRMDTDLSDPDIMIQIETVGGENGNE